MNFRDKLAFLISDKSPVEKEAPKMSQRMDVLSLPEPPNKKDSDYLDAMRGWVYIAVMAIAKEVANINLVLYQRRGKKVEQLEEHEALDVLDRVNGFQTKFDFLEATQAYLELLGESFWFKSRPSEKSPPTELWMLRPDWVKILPPKKESDFIGGYSYKVPGGAKQDDYLVSEIVHFKYFNPKNPSMLYPT
jgi:phage portal protein BeeE